MEHTPTRDTLLDAAESLFAEEGIQAASLRAITRHANANLAAVHYHFGSKEALVRAVFARRLEPIKAERRQLLEAVDLTADDAVEQVVSAFLSPVLRLLQEGSDGVRNFARLMGRAISEPGSEIRTMIKQELAPELHRFLEALAVLVPHLDPSELMWRFHFMAGAMAHTTACGAMIEEMSQGRCSPRDSEGTLRYLVTFLAAGLRAPASTGGEPNA
ncbi:MAG TPA: TetR/AcrR family transcriptional regulator [Thermoanaerobaculia bacterium]